MLQRDDLSVRTFYMTLKSVMNYYKYRLSIQTTSNNYVIHAAHGSRLRELIFI